MWNKLHQYFTGRRFHEVDLHLENSRLYYIAEGSAVNMVWLLREDLVEGLTKEQYGYYEKTIRDIFLKQGYVFVSILSLMLSSNVSKAKEVAEGSMFWIVDQTYGRLIVYENQPEDFLGLRGMIENNLRFGGNSRNSQGAQRTVDSDNFREQCRTMDYNEGRGGTKQRNDIYREYAKKQRRQRRNAFFGRFRDKSWCVYLLIIINVLIFLITDLFRHEEWLFEGALSWQQVANGEWHRIFTSMFLHWDMSHIANNMLVLFGMGDLVEMRIGHLRFAVLYFLSGIGGAAASMWYHWWQDAYVLSAGASGAIYGVAGAVLVMLFMEGKSRTRENMMRIGIFLLLLFSGIFTGGEVDNSAHIGGFVIGSMCYWLIFLRQTAKRKNNRWHPS